MDKSSCKYFKFSYENNVYMVRVGLAASDLLYLRNLEQGKSKLPSLEKIDKLILCNIGGQVPGIFY